jgi:hypothetical protein
MGILGKFNLTVRELGFRTALLYYVCETLSRLSRRRFSVVRYLFVAQPVAQGPLVKRSDPATNIQQIGADHPDAAKFPRPAAIIARRYAAENVCLQATVKGVFAGFLWLAFDAYEEDEIRCRYELAEPSKLVWDFDVYVDPKFRLGRSFARLWDAANELLRARSIGWSISRISAFNPASLAAHSRLGTVPLCYATFLCLGQLQVSFMPHRWLPQISWNEETRPILRLSAPATQPPASPESSID